MVNKVLQTSYKSSILYNDDNWHITNIIDDLPVQKNNPLAVAIVDLNNQWTECTDASVLALVNTDTYYVLQSNSNYHVGGGIAIMYIYFNSKFTGNMEFKIMNDAESNCDYPTVTLDGTTTLYNNTSRTTSFSSFTVTPSGEHTLMVKFKKDNSVDTGRDRAFLAVPKDVSL